jgi:hypothetical protein
MDVLVRFRPSLVFRGGGVYRDTLTCGGNPVGRLYQP